MEVWTDGLVGLSEALGAEVRYLGRVRALRLTAQLGEV